jgi:hypothetical protein
MGIQERLERKFFFFYISAKPYADLGALMNMLHKGMWDLIAPNPAIVAVYTVNMKSLSWR